MSTIRQQINDAMNRLVYIAEKNPALEPTIKTLLEKHLVELQTVLEANKLDNPNGSQGAFDHLRW